MSDDSANRQRDRWDELDGTLRQLGAGGGLISPSIYDTAQCLRFHPPADPGPALDWLAAQQGADGGWATPGTNPEADPRARYLPTLAALLAFAGLQTPSPAARQAIEGGLAFLRERQERDWADGAADAPPGGAELILPRLLTEARELGLPIALKPYAALAELGRRRRRHIAALPANGTPGPAGRLAGTPAAHLWEGWATLPDPAVVDGAGSVGHSPAASAAWLHMARPYQALRATRQAVEAGLAAAWQATTPAIEGVTGPCWPIGHFERAFGLYPLLLAGFFDAPQRIPPEVGLTIAAQLGRLRGALGAEGLGFSHWFCADGDNTAVASALLAAPRASAIAVAGNPPAANPFGAGATIDASALLRFQSGDHFCGWPGELRSASSVTAHALLALARLGADGPLAAGRGFLLARRGPDGLWAGEAWNASGVYASAQAIIALLETGGGAEIAESCAALLAAQRADGSWGTHGTTAEETAYATLALLQARRRGLLPADRGWLRRAGRALESRDSAALWQAKEAYRPARVARAFVLTAQIALADEAGEE